MSNEPNPYTLLDRDKGVFTRKYFEGADELVEKLADKENEVIRLKTVLEAIEKDVAWMKELIN